MENFVLPIFAAIRRNWTKKRTETGRHPDRKKCPKTGQPDKAFVQERLQKMPGDIFSDTGT